MPKKFDTQHKIYVDLCMNLVDNGFSFSHEWDLGELEGTCQECGHPIRYENWFTYNGEGIEVCLGRICSSKLYVLNTWKGKFTMKDLEDKQLFRAGRWLWILRRDHSEQPEMEHVKIPNIEDYKDDYKALADEIKRIVLRLRSIQKNREKEEKERELKIKERNEKIKEVKEFLSKHGIDIKVCTQQDKKFLQTVFKWEGNGWELKPKQQKWLEDIIKRSSNIQNEDNEKTQVSGEKENNLEYLDNLLQESKTRWDSLTEWEQSFIPSVIEQVSGGKSISEKQMTYLKRIEDKIKQQNNGFDSFLGKKTKKWVINEKFGVWTTAKITSVKQISSSGLAILCDVILDGVQTENEFSDVWIPLSQIQEEIEL